MKKLLIVTLIAGLVACANTPKEDSLVSPDAVKYTQDFGKVEVTYTDTTWLEIKSSATSSVPIGDDAGLEQAMNIATLRAKRNLVEFINTDLKSGKTVDVMANSLAKEISDDGDRSKQTAANIATKVSERISVDANGILKGVYVTERKVSPDAKTVMVSVKVDKRSMKAAQQIRISMGN